MSAKAFSPTIQHIGIIGITSMKKHIDNEHEAIVAKYVLHHNMKTKFPVRIMKRARSANELHLLQ